jgi:hypothetical protein
MTKPSGRTIQVPAAVPASVVNRYDRVLYVEES